MAAPTPLHDSVGHAPSPARTDPHPVDIAVICSFLRAADGRWRSARPTREHRCTAVLQPLPVTLDKQASLCLVALHPTCPRYVSATTTTHPASLVAQRAAAWGFAASVPVLLEPLVAQRAAAWGFAATVPVLLEPSRLHLDRIRSWRARSVGQALLGVLMILAFVAVVLARTAVPA